MRSRAALTTATALAALLVTAACSGGDADPKVLPTLSPGPSATPTSALVEVPAAARARTPQGAAEFVRHYFSQVNLAFTSADSRQLAGLGDATCGTCASYIATVDQFAATGQRIRGIAVRVLSAEAPPEEGGYIEVSVRLDAPPRELIKSNGSLVRRLPPDRAYSSSVYVHWIRGQWLVRAVKRA